MKPFNESASTSDFRKAVTINLNKKSRGATEETVQVHKTTLHFYMYKASQQTKKTS
jgi:hypothetical protein